MRLASTLRSFGLVMLMAASLASPARAGLASTVCVPPLPAHDTWVRTDTGGTLHDPARYGSASYQLYKATDAAVDRLVEKNETALRAQAAAV